MRFIFKTIKILAVLFLLAFIGAGFYAGNTAYEALLAEPWEKILGIANHTKELSRIHQREERNGWETVNITSADGTKLHGTYIEDSRRSKHTVILLHGLYQNRSMCLPYVSLYRDLGYNVLLIDQRGHGESGGDHTTWGIRETDDLDAWVKWLKGKDGNMEIGMHGISLGAAMALIYSGTENGKHISFYIADSAYGNLMELGKDKLSAYTGDTRLLWGMDVVDPFFQSVMWLKSGKTLSDIDPVEAVKRMTSPVLFLHGGADTLVPPKTAEELAAASGSRKKELFIFDGAAHTMEMAANGEAYRNAIHGFLENISQHLIQ